MLWNIPELNPNLTQDAEGYVYWKGRQVEHYSYRSGESGDNERERTAALELTRRCKHIETLGLNVTTSTAIWHWGWLAGLTPEKFQNLSFTAKWIFTHGAGGLYEDKSGRICWSIGHKKVSDDPGDWRSVSTFAVFNHGRYEDLIVIPSDDIGGYYHVMLALGWKDPDMGQDLYHPGAQCGCCYATTEQVIAWMKRKGAL